MSGALTKFVSRAGIRRRPAKFTAHAQWRRLGLVAPA
jgi:hypothetical protein